MKQAGLAPLLLAAALLGLAGCDSMDMGVGKPAPVATVPAPPPPDPKTEMAGLETRIVILIEEQREKLDPKAHTLAIDPELSRIARARAEDMAAKNYLAHAAPNGDTSASLLMAGDAKWQGLLGENLAAQHYVKESGVDIDQFAKRFLDEWMKSQPHRDNLAFPQYDRTGVGAAVNGDTVYVAQLFASDLGLPPPPADAPAGVVTSFDSPAAASADGQKTAPDDSLHLRGTEGRQ
jgi:uncharacterized protein YkwD